MEILIIAGLVVTAILALWVLMRLVGRALRVAAVILSWASEQGFIGVAIYVACWIFMFPVMVVICLIGGAIVWIVERHEQREYERRRMIEAANEPLSEDESTAWEQGDKRHEEARARRLRKRLDGE